MVQGLPVTSGRVQPDRSCREPASRARTAHRMRPAAPGSSTPGTSAPKTVRGAAERTHSRSVQRTVGATPSTG
ncbi:hypothetical protein CGZ69_18970 [Streptomyces peucetius subsp. caesius ATCC 27952]|nr:hypothetical protein CGZ69_18970 [Streptomyces peucetius subsp. caesius ATCC 27952]